MAPSGTPAPPPSPRPGRKAPVATHRVSGDALPAPVAGLVFVVTIVASLVLSRFQADALALIGLLVIAPVADIVVSPRVRALAVTCGACAVYVGVVADGYWSGLGWLLPPLVLFTLTVLIGFRALAARAGLVAWLNERQQVRDDRQITDLWTRIRTTWGLPEGTSYAGSRRTQSGFRLTFRTPAAATVLKDRLAKIAARTGFPSSAVTFTGDAQDHSYGHVNFQTKDPLADPVLWTPPRPGKESILKGCPLAVSASGKVMRLPLTETHVRLSGSTRSGKTTAMEVLMAYVAACHDAVMIVVEVPKGCADFRRWWPRMGRVAPSYAAARKVLLDVQQIADERKRTRMMAEVGTRDGTWKPTTAEPQVVVFIDEAQTIFSEKDLAELMKHFAAELSGMGVTLVLGISNPVEKMMNTVVKRQMMTRVCFKVSNRTQSAVALDVEPDRDDPDNTDASLLPFKSGHCLIYTADMAAPKRHRAFWATHDALNAYAASLDPVTWAKPHPLLDPNDPDLLPDRLRDSLTDDETADLAPAAAPSAARWAPPSSALAVIEPETTPDTRPDPATLHPAATAVWAAVAALAATGGHPSQADIVRAVGKDPKTVRAACKALVAAGWLTESRVGRAVRYRIGVPPS